ncbi:HET and ankyrin domain protein [Colletotrichum asianum]
METLASNHPWSDNLTVLGGNPQHKPCEDQTAVRKQTAPSSILAVCRDQNRERRHVPWTHRISLLDKADAATPETPASDAENDPYPDDQSTTSSMVAQPSYAATEPDNDNVADELSVNAERRSIDQLVKNHSRDAHDLAFMGEWDQNHNPPELITVEDPIQPNEIHDWTIQQKWKNLAQKHDHVDGPWDHRLQLVGPTSSQSEPTLTDGSTVDSESVFSNGYPRDISTVSQSDQASRPFQSFTAATTVASSSQDIGKELHELQRGSGGRGGSRRGRSGRGGHAQDASSSSNDLTTDSTQPTSEISSARVSNDLKRRQGDEDDDHGAGDDNKEDRSRAKRSKTVTPAKKVFACLYEKREPLGTNNCSKLGFSNIPHLKQHLKRCHYRPVHCPVCGKTFKDRDTCDGHIKERDCKPGELPVGISEDVQNRIEQRRPPKMDKKGHWYLLWRYIFPLVPPPLSPFKLAPWTEACDIFQDKFQKQTPVIKNLLLSSGFPPLEPQIGGILKVMEDWIKSLRDADPEATEYSEETAYGSSAEQEEGQTDQEDTGVLEEKGKGRQDPVPDPESGTATEPEQSRIGQPVSSGVFADVVGWPHACPMSNSFGQGFGSFYPDLEDMEPGLEVMGPGLEGMGPDPGDTDPSDTIGDDSALFERFLEVGGHPPL